MSFEPKILALCCHYCAYAAADLAGSMRVQYPPNVRVLRLPCTGKVDIGYIMEAFEKGVDGVIIAGCLEGGCHFQEGNLRARKRVEFAKQILEEAGIEPERLEMFNLSSAMGQTFAEIATQVTERIRKLGPSPLKGSGDKVSAKAQTTSRAGEPNR
jgi:F420-non-reducing hydrogenase iron-sulfur subunit